MARTRINPEALLATENKTPATPAKTEVQIGNPGEMIYLPLGSWQLTCIVAEIESKPV